MPLRILIFSPASHVYWHSPGLWVEPLGIGYVAAAARRAGHEVRLIDQPTARHVPDAVITRCCASLDPDVVAFSANTENWSTALRLSRACRAIAPRAVVVAGGVFASTAPAPLADPVVDYAVVGEGEATFVELLARIEAGERVPADVPGLVYRDGGAVVATAPRPLVDDLDALPLPARDGMCREAYHVSLMLTPLRQRTYAVITSRGCVHNCAFCLSPRLWHRTVRRRSPAAVGDELAALARGGMNTCFFIDENFLCDHGHAAAVCEEILRRGLAFSWIAFSTLAPAPGDLLALMRRAGCRALIFGLERLDGDLQRSMRKVRPDADVRGALGAAQRHGIITHCPVILGLPGDTEEKIRADLGRCGGLPLDFLSPVFAVPFHGTRWHEEVAARGAFVTEDLDRWNVREPIIDLPGLPPARLRRLMRGSLARFYLRPGYLARSLARVARDPAAAAGYARLFARWIRR